MDCSEGLREVLMLCWVINEPELLLGLMLIEW